MWCENGRGGITLTTNNSNNKSSSTKGIGFVGALQILFIALKLLGKISWSWVWVLAPIWMYPILSIIFIILVTLAVIIRK